MTDLTDQQEEAKEDLSPDKYEEDLSPANLQTITTTDSVADYIAEKQEDTRSKLASQLLWLLIGTYIGSFLVLIGVIVYPMQTNVDQSTVYTYTKDVVTLLITTQTALVGTALGFYFGSRNNK